MSVFEQMLPERVKTRMALAAEPEPPWRWLTCTYCDREVEVLEIPGPYLDPLTFCCGLCRPAK
jgi:hypothetical protein